MYTVNNLGYIKIRKMSENEETLYPRAAAASQTEDYMPVDQNDRVVAQNRTRGGSRKKYIVLGVGVLVLAIIGIIVAVTLLGQGAEPTLAPPTVTTVQTTESVEMEMDMELYADAGWVAIRGECGRPKEPPQTGRIVGGTEAKRNSWPWQVGVLQYMRFDARSSSVKASCGGTLVGPKYIITATHCFLSADRTSVSSDVEGYRIIVGAHYKGKAVGGARIVELRSIHHHPKNNVATFQKLDQLLVHDITVVILKTVIDPNVPSPITGFACLPKVNVVPPPGKRCWASGWGKTMGSGYNKVLKQVVQPVVSEQTCSKRYGSGDIHANIHLCAGPEQGYMGTCQGDSGGPLVCQYSDGTWVLHGATSFGPQPCGTNPGVWAQVSHHMEWICCFLNSYGPCKDIKCIPI